MNDVNRNILIRLYKQKSKNFENITKPNNLSFKKSFHKTFNNIYKQEQNELSQENSKIFLYENNDNFKTLILPSILNSSTHSKLKLNSSFINNYNIESSLNQGKNHNVKLKKIKMKKNKSKSTSKLKKKLLNIYKENFQLKKKFEKYKAKNAEDMKNFSYENYNNNLLKLSSINISKNSYNIFKKNMQTIELNLKGEKLKVKNRWLIFLEKIGDFAPETLKRRIKSLSERKKLDKLEN